MKNPSTDYLALPFLLGAAALISLSSTDGSVMNVVVIAALFFFMAVGAFAILLVRFLLKLRPQYFTEWHLVGLAISVVVLWVFALTPQAIVAKNLVQVLWDFRGMGFYWLLVICLFIISWHVVLVIKRRQPFFAHRWWLQSIAIIISLAVFISVPQTQWPFHLACRISLSEVRRVGLDLQAGKTFPDSMKVGVFTVERAQLDEDSQTVCLWTSLDPAGRQGFVFEPKPGFAFNLQTEHELGDGWFYLVED